MAKIIILALLEGEQVGSHRFAAHTAQNCTQGVQVFKLDGWRAGYDKQQMDRHSVFRTEFNTFSAEA